jgi:MFS transporter, DHA1 family, tetracycline resistance protein
MSKEKALIIFTVAIDVIGLGIIIPVLPLYVKSFGLTPFTVTLLLSIFSLFSFLSAPFLGALSDKIGRRPVLLISIASTALGWLIFSLARNLPMLLIGRIIDGIAAGNFSTAQSSISDLSKDSKERAANLGIIGMIFGLGFIIGPFIGGILSKVSPSFPFLFVSILAFVNVTLAYFFLPETNKHIDKSKKIIWNPSRPLITAIRNKKLRTLYLVWFIFNIVAVVGNSVFALYLSQIFGFSAFTTGLFFTGLGVILTLNQGFLIRKFWLGKFKEKQLIIIMLGFFAFGFLSMTFPFIWFFILGMIFTAFGQSTLNVAMTSEIVGEASITERGESVGILSAIASAAMVLAPLISGSIFQIKPFLPYILCSILSVLALVIMYRVKVADRQGPEISELASEVIV